MSLRIAAAQHNFWVGDVEGNVDRIIRAAHDARDRLKADLIVFPELSILGYPPDDLLQRSGLPPVIEQGLRRIGHEVQGIHLVVGHPEYTEEGIYNSATVFRDRRVVARCRKQLLPNYGVFDEKRHFLPGRGSCVFGLNEVAVGLCICEDIWGPGPAQQARRHGAEVLININASPFSLGKSAERRTILGARAQESGLPLLYVNLVGGQDDLLFDGDSVAMDADGRIAFRAPAFEEGTYLVEFDGGRFRGEVAREEPEEALVYQGLVQAVRDYVDRNGFRGALVGMSGGVDSALVAAVAADALGPRRVWGVSLPSRYTAGMSNDDAEAQARAMGIRYSTLPIEPAFAAFLSTLAPEFAGQPADLTEENLQSRCRGVLLMALSNKFGYLVLSTGNKS
ncbi:MAG TPA: NAD(+) synthase, partial [Candidatus Binatia bacterium]|nr:NAD(+) synthase [Candidatus Binatia bacterium]